MSDLLSRMKLELPAETHSHLNPKETEYDPPNHSSSKRDLSLEGPKYRSADFVFIDSRFEHRQHVYAVFGQYIGS